MTIRTEEWYTKELVQGNPDWLFVFGDNTVRQGRGGQAEACRDEPNTIGVRVKWFPSTSPSAYFTDQFYDICIQIIDNDLDVIETHLKAGDTVVFPKDGIGTGLALLEEKAPRVYAYLQKRLDEIQNGTFAKEEYRPSGKTSKSSIVKISKNCKEDEVPN